jgi:hypothetical protein
MAEICLKVESLNGNTAKEDLQNLVSRLENIYKMTFDELKKI